MTDPNGSATGGQPGADGGAGTGAAAPWFGADASPDIKGFVETKGWDVPTKAIESYQNLEKLLGADKAGRGVIWPKDDTDTEGWAAIHAKLGVPAKAEDYKLPVPEGADDSFAKAIAPELHKLGITAKQAEGLANWMNAHNAQSQQALDAEATTTIEAQKSELKAEWGGAYDQNMDVAKRAARSLGFDAATIDALEGSVGYKAVMGAMLKVGQKIGEDTFAGGGDPVGRNLSPDGARVRLDQLKKDQGFMAKVLSGDVVAKEQIDLLNANMLGMTLKDYREARASF
jgi:hypothetical protein